ncbi:MAG: hypothetical protein KGJ59_02075 [Bacteroidota bacterium]|nr:hypothetical protein [Bacteroidota bacterium]
MVRIKNPFGKMFSLAIILLVGAVVALAGGKDGKIAGVISGAHCGVNGMACPATHDLHRAELPGVFTNDKKFYFVTNVPQEFLAQWSPGTAISVEGTAYEPARAIDAQKISVKQNGKWREAFAEGSIIDPMGHKEKLSSAVEVNGTWYCTECAHMMQHTGAMKK